MKGAATLVPMFLGPEIATVYSGYLVSRELAKALPMVYDITTAWADSPECPAIFNTISAMA
jgi:hypothetical protein